MIDELKLVFKLKKAADRGLPIIVPVYPDGTFNMLFPERVYGGTIEYWDPRRGEMRTIVPRHVLRYGRVAMVIVPSGFLESVGYEGLAFLALPDDLKRDVQHAIVERLIEAVKEERSDAVVKVFEALGIEYEPPSEELPPELAEKKSEEFEEALTQAKEKILGSVAAAAIAATVMKRHGIVNVPAVELAAMLERAAEIFDVKPEEVLFAERLKMQGVIADIIGQLAYYKKRPWDWKRLLALAGIAVLVIVLLLMIPNIVSGFQHMETVKVP